MSDVIKTSATSLYVQKYPGAPVIYLGDQDARCFNLDSLPNPRGGKDPIFCLDAHGNYVVKGTKKTPRDLASFTIEELLASAASELDLINQNCSFVFHALQNCQVAGVFEGWERGSSYYGVDLTGDDSISPGAQRDAADEMAHAREMTADSPRYDVWEILASQKTTTEAQDANTIHSFVIENCGGVCGPQAEVCEVLVIGCDATGAATANVLRSTDGGNTWAATAADPFAGVAENINAIRMFQVGVNTVRILAARNTDAGNPGEVSYSDDNGATWTEVAYGATNGEFVEAHDCLMVINETNLWLCTDQGNVYKSVDGGLSWTVQSSALVASGGNDLMAMHFVSSKIGVAVGDADTVIYTRDGGNNWVAATATGGGNNLLGVHVFDRYRWIVSDDGGQLWQTWDGGLSWTEMTDFTGTGTGSLNGVRFLAPLHGFMNHVDAAGDGRILRTINGGLSWTRVTGAYGDAGLNALHPCTVNHVFAVGDDDGTRAVILEAGS